MKLIMKKKKLSKRLDLRKKEISRISSINGGIVAVPINLKTNDARCISKVGSCLCMTYEECNSIQIACPI
jgi:hypothetical protein